MHTHEETYRSHYSAEQLYKIVGDVRSYPEFLPWVSACRIREETAEYIIAELLINFKAFRSSYTSKVWLKDCQSGVYSIDVGLVEGPFKALVNHWSFRPCEDGSCEIKFFLEFAFKSKILSNMLDKVFCTVVSRMVKAFEDRAQQIYGKKKD